MVMPFQTCMAFFPLLRTKYVFCQHIEAFEKQEVLGSVDLIYIRCAPELP